MNLPYYIVVYTDSGDYRLVRLEQEGTSLSNVPDGSSWGSFNSVQNAVAVRNALNATNV